MAQMIINIPDSLATRAINGVCNFHNYTFQKLPNETKTAFAKRMLRQTIIQWCKQAEEAIALDTARVNVATQTADFDTITES
jgi:hypothetical protein